MEQLALQGNLIEQSAKFTLSVARFISSPNFNGFVITDGSQPPSSRFKADTPHSWGVRVWNTPHTSIKALQPNTQSRSKPTQCCEARPVISFLLVKFDGIVVAARRKDLQASDNTLHETVIEEDVECERFTRGTYLDVRMPLNTLDILRVSRQHTLTLELTVLLINFSKTSITKG